MVLIFILESKSQFGTRIIKSLKLVLFLVKRLKFDLYVKSGLTLGCLVSIPLFFDFFDYLFFDYFLLNATCKAVVVPRDSDRVMWQ